MLRQPRTVFLRLYDDSLGPRKFFSASVYVQSSIMNFEKRLIFIYRKPSVQRDWVSLERKSWSPVGRGKKETAV